MTIVVRSDWSEKKAEDLTKKEEEESQNQEGATWLLLFF